MKTYRETLNWMYAQLPMYQRVGDKALKKDLTNITALCNELGNPQHTFKSIHVGGTNGKGSTCHMMASILQEAGYKVGLYTSPHLKDFTERIKINGKDIPSQQVVDFIAEHQSFLEKQGVSFFEMTVGLAFHYFAKETIDIAVVEVGLGGRLDSTNILVPELSVITNIGLDHTHILGHTMAEIAAEKAGIIKKGVPVVIGERQKETEIIFTTKAKELDAPLCFASDSVVSYKTDLLGNYQKQNSRTAVVALKQLEGFLISEKAIHQGLLNVVTNTNLKGRWQILQQNPKVICDTAHNKEGLRCVLSQLLKEDCKTLHIVMGVVSDKDLDSILPLFPKTGVYYFCKPCVPRGLSSETLQQKAKGYGLLGKSYPSVVAALEASKVAANEQDIIYVGGSTFVVAEII